MDVLNPALYRVLQHRYGTVKVSSRGAPYQYRVETDPVTRRPKVIQIHGGEQYCVCCPLCGEQRHRLVIGHRWLTRPAPHLPMLTSNAICYNTHCQVTRIEFYGDILRDLHDAEIGIALREIDQPKVVEPPKIETRLPVGTVPLTSLPADHPALAFLASKYTGLDPRYLSDCYAVGFTDQPDPYYKLAQNRVIFPIFDKGELRGWQGRTIDRANTIRWVLSSGFHKTFYNGDRIGPNHYPVIAEGIPSAIACGPTGTCIFGKELDELRAKEFGSRWEGAIIALDPETFIPDEREGSNGKVFAHVLRDKLAKYCKGPVYLLPWPESILDVARRKLEYSIAKQEAKAKGQEIPDQDLIVPDPADIGPRGMIELLSQVPRRTVL